jgi:hypothetical protein
LLVYRRLLLPPSDFPSKLPAGVYDAWTVVG